MLQTTPFLLFDGTCSEAMTFYRACFGGELVLTKLSDTPMKAQFEENKHGRIIYAHLKNEAIDLSGADWMASPNLDPIHGNTVSIYLTGSNYDELKPVFEKLAEGADMNKRTFMELADVPFGVYGQLTDKFRVSWIFKGDR